ncbi:MAG: nitroreductase family protein [Patescibacteria group bacterium]|nr:nitroreductase family protein [Patescibacteria group bacterium]
MSFLKNLNWRFAAKKFAADKPLAEESLHKILKAIQLVPTSRGLQPFHVYVIDNHAWKNKLKPIANDQSQLDGCAYLLVFCALVGRTALLKRADKYVELTADKQKQKISELTSLSVATQNTVSKKTDQELEIWALRQAYIALGFALAAAAELKIDSCPMEGFNRKEMDIALQLPAWQKSQALLALGYRSEEPKYPKIRFPENDLFTYL